MNLPFYTIGHSTRTIEEFVELLRAADVKQVIDVRTVPRSRTNPQYNKDTLPDSLKPFDIDYIHLAELGGLRSKIKTVPPEVNQLWRNQSFHNYADYALSENFDHGLEQLIVLGQKQICAIMCSEAVWWRCHRRIITDYLLTRGKAVFHLMNKNSIIEATITKGAQITALKKLVYPLPAEHNTQTELPL